MMLCIACRSPLELNFYGLGYCNNCYKDMIINYHDQLISQILRYEQHIKEQQYGLSIAREMIQKLRKEAERCGFELEGNEKAPT